MTQITSVPLPGLTNLKMPLQQKSLRFPTASSQAPKNYASSANSTGNFVSVLYFKS